MEEIRQIRGEDGIIALDEKKESVEVLDEYTLSTQITMFEGRAETILDGGNDQHTTSGVISPIQHKKTLNIPTVVSKVGGIDNLFTDLPSKTKVLDFFAGEGKDVTPYLSHFQNLTCWELIPARAAKLKMRIPHAQVSVGDSFKMALKTEEHQYDLIVFDNHLGCYGEHVEHFDALGLVPRLLKWQGGDVVFNAVTDPRIYLVSHLLRNHGDYWGNIVALWKKKDSRVEWHSARRSYYGALALDIRKLCSFYDEVFSDMGYVTQKIIDVMRLPGLHTIRFSLRNRY